jgi:hypothetical protein
MKVYIIGSLRNPEVPKLATYLRERGLGDVFDDWYAAGPEADDKWMEYEKAKGSTYSEALDGRPAEQVFDYDRKNIETSDAVVLALPAGKSAHMEFGWAIGKGIPGYILMDKEPERWDVMYRFADEVIIGQEDLATELLNLQDVVDNAGVGF